MLLLGTPSTVDATDHDLLLPPLSSCAFRWVIHDRRAAHAAFIDPSGIGSQNRLRRGSTTGPDQGGMIERVAWSGSELEGRTEEVTVDAFGEDEQLGAFACVLDDLLEDPAPASVLSEAVELLGVRAGGRFLGLRARCRPQGLGVGGGLGRCHSRGVRRSRARRYRRRVPPPAQRGLGMITNSLQDIIAITAAATPEHLCATCWRVQPCAPSPNDFEAMVAFRGCTTTGPRARYARPGCCAPTPAGGGSPRR